MIPSKYNYFILKFKVKTDLNIRPHLKKDYDVEGANDGAVHWNAENKNKIS